MRNNRRRISMVLRMHLTHIHENRLVDVIIMHIIYPAVTQRTLMYPLDRMKKWKDEWKQAAKATVPFTCNLPLSASFWHIIPSRHMELDTICLFTKKFQIVSH